MNTPQLLIVDEPSSGKRLQDLLELEGFRCLQARGPIMVQKTLSETEVDLIVWKEEERPAGLNQDLIRIFEAFPEIPVVQLFGATTPEDSLGGEEVQASLPLAAVQTRLVPLLWGMIRPMASTPPPGEAPPSQRASLVPPPGGELAFRHMLQNAFPSTPVSSPQAELTPEQPEAPANPNAPSNSNAWGTDAMALKDAERDMLMLVANTSSEASTSKKGFWAKIWRR